MMAQTSLLVVFSVSGRMLAVPAEAVAEIVPEPALVVPPDMPAVLAGLFSLRGRVVPVVRPDVLLGLPPPGRGAFRAVLVLAAERSAWALLVERVLAVAEVGPPAPVPDDSAFNDCVVGLAATADGPVPVLSPAHLLRRREAAALAEFSARAAERWEDFAIGHA